MGDVTGAVASAPKIRGVYVQGLIEGRPCRQFKSGEVGRWKHQEEGVPVTMNPSAPLHRVDEFFIVR